MDINAFVISEEGQDLINSGTWVGDFDEAPGVRLKVKGLRADDVEKHRKKLEAEMLIKNRNKPLNEDQNAKMMCNLLADAVLQDWDGFTDKGEPLPYDKALAKEWLTSKRGDKFAMLVLSAATRLDKEANELVESLKKT